MGSKPKGTRGAVDPSLDLIAEGLSDVTGSAFIRATHAKTDAYDRPMPPFDSTDFKLDYLRATWLSKVSDVECGIDKRAKAFERFAAGERACADANRRLVHHTWRASTVGISPLLVRAARIIRNVLGDLSVEEVVEGCDFGPGATTLLRRRSAARQNKWVKSAHVTLEAKPYAEAFHKYCGAHWEFPELVIVRGNKVTTVPKSVKTDRTIAIEPDWNMFFQKGLGRALRRRLRRVGLLYPDSQMRHRKLAREGSVTRKLATLDLSNASDSVSLALVDALIPWQWLVHIMRLRSPSGKLGMYDISYAKVSSMGNGYTFELETLIFWALAKAVDTDAFVSVYGDDIVCEDHVVGRLVELLTACGFTLNEGKSYHGNAPFRESCGGHFLNGEDVTPFYIRRSKDWNVLDRVVMANAITLWSNCAGLYRRPELRAAWEYLRDSIRRENRGPWLPERPFGGLLWCDWDEATPRWSTRKQAFMVRPLTADSAYTDAPPDGGLRAWTWATRGKDVLTDGDEMMWSKLNRASGKVKVASTPTFLCRTQWDNLPAWLSC